MATHLVSSPEIKTFVFMDIETTGLPLYENNTTKITELCLTAVHASHLRLGAFPRVQNKLNLCFNPCKLISADSEKITGLSNTLLEESYKFSKETVESISNFLNHNPQPICFVAHNGLRFDYPLLRREINKTNTSLDTNILCIDTLVTFRELLVEKNELKIENMITDIDTVDNIQCDQPLFECMAQQMNETTPSKQIIKNPYNSPPVKKIKVDNVRKKIEFGPSYKLGDIFTRLTNKQPINSHQADGDVQMLIMCAATLGDRFVDWSNENSKRFCDVPAMVPGKKIGT